MPAEAAPAAPHSVERAPPGACLKRRGAVRRSMTALELSSLASPTDREPDLPPPVPTNDRSGAKPAVVIDLRERLLGIERRRADWVLTLRARRDRVERLAQRRPLRELFGEA